MAFPRATIAPPQAEVKRSACVEIPRAMRLTDVADVDRALTSAAGIARARPKTGSVLSRPRGGILVDHGDCWPSESISAMRSRI